MRASGVEVPDELLAHVAPLGGEHIGPTGNYLWNQNDPEADPAAASADTGSRPRPAWRPRVLTETPRECQELDPGSTCLDCGATCVSSAKTGARLEMITAKQGIFIGRAAVLPGSRLANPQIGVLAAPPMDREYDVTHRIIDIDRHGRRVFSRLARLQISHTAGRDLPIFSNRAAVRRLSGSQAA